MIFQSDLNLEAVISLRVLKKKGPSDGYENLNPVSYTSHPINMRETVINVTEIETHTKVRIRVFFTEDIKWVEGTWELLTKRKTKNLIASSLFYINLQVRSEIFVIYRVQWNLVKRVNSDDHSRLT